jgi:Putative prokaryotic signal transducing protein
MSQSSNWVKVHDEFDFFRAELLKNYLMEEHEIEAVVVNKQISGYNFGKCEIHVMAENEQVAKDLIETFGK